MNSQSTADLRGKKIQIMAQKLTTPRSWSASIHDTMISMGIISSATPVSKLFDRLPKQTTVLMTGLDGVGKTTLLRNHLSQDSGRDIHTHSPFVGFCLEEVRYSRVCFQTFDLGGARKTSFRRLEKAFFKLCDVVVYVIDAADRDRFVEALEEFSYGLNAEEGFRKGVPILVLAQKMGEKNAITSEEMKKAFRKFLIKQQQQQQQQQQNVTEYVTERPWHIAGIDIQTGDGVLEAFKWLRSTLLMYKQTVKFEQKQEPEMVEVQKGLKK